MTAEELQIQLDISSGNELEVLKQHAYVTSYGYLFVDSSDGHCCLFSISGKQNDIRKVKSIKNYALANCISLKHIVIPDSVKSIGNSAFWNCTSLREVIFKGKTIDQVEAMNKYPWGIKGRSVIKCR